MQYLKQNLKQFTWNKLLYCLCSNKAKIWSCCFTKAWMSWLCWVCIYWFCIQNWLCYLSRTSLSFFSSCKSSYLNLWSCSSFSRKNPVTFELDLLLSLLSSVSLSSCPLRFLVPLNLSFVFFLISWAFFLSFSIPGCLFWVSASVLQSLSSNFSIRSSRSCSFSESSSTLRLAPATSCLVFDLYFSWGY